MFPSSLPILTHPCRLGHLFLQYFTSLQDFGISNTQYGVVQSAVSLVNTVLPVLGGLFIDSFGTSRGSILATTAILLGTVVVAISTHHRSFATMVAGRLLYGLGSGTIVTVQETILSHWFHGKGLALTIALQIATARLASFLSMGTTIPIANATGFYGYAFWASAFVCLCSWAINLGYVLLMKRINEHLSSTALAKLRQKNNFRLHHVLLFPALYWLIVTLSFVIGSGWTTFLHISSELVKLRFSLDDLTAAHSASVSQLLPVFLVPFLGVLVDRRGHRITGILVAAVTFTFAILLLGFTKLTPILGMFIFSISLSVGPIAAVSSVPLVLPLSTVGSGLGIYKSAQNIGNTIVDIIIGQLQDSHHPDTTNDKGQWPTVLDSDSDLPDWSWSDLDWWPMMKKMAPLRGEHAYDRVMAFFVVWGCLGILVTLAIYFVDRCGWDQLLQLNDRKRKLWAMTHANVFCHYQLNTEPITLPKPSTHPNTDDDEDRAPLVVLSPNDLTASSLTGIPPQLIRTTDGDVLPAELPSNHRHCSTVPTSPSELSFPTDRLYPARCPHHAENFHRLNDIESCPKDDQCKDCQECSQAHDLSAYVAYGGPILAQTSANRTLGRMAHRNAKTGGRCHRLGKHTARLTSRGSRGVEMPSTASAGTTSTTYSSDNSGDSSLSSGEESDIEDTDGNIGQNNSNLQRRSRKRRKGKLPLTAQRPESKRSHWEPQPESEFPIRPVVTTRRISLPLDSGTTLICSSTGCPPEVCSPRTCGTSCLLTNPPTVVGDQLDQDSRSTALADATTYPTRYIQPGGDGRGEATSLAQLEADTSPATLVATTSVAYRITWWHWLPPSIYLSLLSISWVLFFRYLL
ncbi:hypothetical protein IWQ62_003692 [Dispira parvispora]|uniref:Lysosomal dipeptide transporter MFSD1 n=1 Tax=Dispira parvispora TaxID=1520584 RepID=A0A9W8E6B0_9FUNG|nr:hypothetical protein IWQ62_003692 [Dispira parvispora]